MQALVSGVPKGALVMLDLYAEVFPLWKATESFYGADFIFCMLHNFGGNIEMYGALPAVSGSPQEPMHSSGGMIGVGMCPEGIEQNPIVYDLMSEWAFRYAGLPQRCRLQSSFLIPPGFMYIDIPESSCAVSL